MSNITLNIVAPDTPTPTPLDPAIDPAVPDTGLFIHGIGGTEATIIATSAVLILTIVAIIITAILYKKHKKQNKISKLVHLVDSAKAVITSKKRLSAALTAVALLASVGTFIALTKNAVNATNTDEQALDTSEESNLTVNVSNEELTIELADEPVFAILPVEVSVAEATEAGYTLTAFADSTDLVSTTDESNTISMVAVGDDELVALTDNTYGLSLDEEPTSKDDEVYITLSIDSEEPTIIKSMTDYAPTEENDTTTIYYGFYITPDTPYGTYTSADITYNVEANRPDLATIIFDGNGLYFGNATRIINAVKYAPGNQSAPRYSRTPNVNSQGMQTEGEMYPLDSNETFVYEFDNVDNVYVDVVKTGNDSGCGSDQDDYFSIWPGTYPDYTAKANWETALSLKGSNGKNVFGNNGEYDGAGVNIEGNAVTIAYTTNNKRQSYCLRSGYGYYARVIGYNPNILVSGEYESPATDGAYRFLGWSEDPEATIPTYPNEEAIAKGLALTPGANTTLYAIWQPLLEITYNGNGADSTTNMDNVTQYATGLEFETKDVDLLAPNFTRENYGFAGWSTDTDAWSHLTDTNPDNDPAIYGPNQTIAVDKDIIAEAGENRKLVLNAVWVPAEKDNSVPVTLQGWNGCSALTPTIYDAETNTLSVGKNTITALMDNRDGEIYTIARLADGNCWMIENLRLDNSTAYGSTTSEFSFANTNNPSLPITNEYSSSTTTNRLSGNSDEWCSGWGGASCDNQSKLNTSNTALTATSPVFSQDFTNNAHDDSLDDNIASYGNYYNWYSATAGNGKYGTGRNVTVDGDICPAGWHLPYGGNQTGEKGGNANGGFYYLNRQMGKGRSATDSNNWRSFPNNFIYSGYKYESSISARGSRGEYWSSTGKEAGSAFYLDLFSYKVDPDLSDSTSNSHKADGRSVRCMTPGQ